MVPSPPLLLGLDLGTSRCKALLLDRSGHESGHASATTPFVHRGDRVEMGVGALRSTFELLLRDLGAARAQVVAVGITGMAESGAPLDAAGEALAPVMAWHDPRGTEAVTTLEEGFGDELPRRIGQRIRTVSSVAKLGWLVGHGVTGTRRWLGVPELCLFALTGRQATDPSLAARTGAYDIVEHRWIEEVPAHLGFDVEVFPTVHPAGSSMGRIDEGATRWAGLPPGTPVTLAGHDHLAALAGSGATAADFGNSVGTAESVVALTGTLPDLDRALTRGVAVSLSPAGDGWATLAGAARAGNAITTVARTLGASPPVLDRLAEGAGRSPRPDLLDRALAGDVVVSPGEAPGEVWNALLGALSERTWEAVGRAADIVGPPARVVVFGGGARSRRWLSAKAQLGDVAVWRSTTREAAARGAALVAGVAAGWWSSPQDAPRAPLEHIRPT